MAQALMFAIGGILTGVLNLLFGDAFRPAMPWFIQRLLALAIKCLPEPQQERFAEEWTSHMNDVPGDIRRILFAWGCVSAARDMAASARDVAASLRREIAQSYLASLKRSFVRLEKPQSFPAFCSCGVTVLTIEKTATCPKCGGTLVRQGMHVKVGPVRPDGTPHPHGGKTGKTMRFINIYSDPYWLGPSSAMLELDSMVEGFIWVSLASLEVLPQIILVETPTRSAALIERRSDFDVVTSPH